MPLGKEFRTIPQLVGTHLIEESHSDRHARLIHTHERELELLYVYSGEGEYTVNSRSYYVHLGDMVICNANILHGEDPRQKRKMRSYSIALTAVSVDGLPDNHLIPDSSNPVVNCGNLTEMIGPMMRLIYLLFSPQRHLSQVCQHMALAILLLTYDLIKQRESGSLQRITEPDSILAKRIQRYLDEHYNEPLTLQSVSEALHISAYYLAHIFKEEIGMPPMQYVTKRRMGEAQTLLMDTNLAIADIADQLGYGNPWNFSTAFNKLVGMSPSQYRQAFRCMSDEKEENP